MIQFKSDPKVILTWIIVLGIIIFAFVDHRITWEVMIGYFATLGVPSLLMAKRDPNTAERRTDRADTSPLPATVIDEKIIDSKESGQL